MTTYTLPVVGAHFRPPAKAILALAPLGWSLRLQREPSNQYDPFAIQVLGTILEIDFQQDDIERRREAKDPEWPESALNLLSEQLGGYGSELSAVLGQEIHLGYLPATQPKKLPPVQALAARLAPLLDELGGSAAATLTVGQDGSPAVKFEL